MNRQDGKMNRKGKSHEFRGCPHRYIAIFFFFLFFIQRETLISNRAREHENIKMAGDKNARTHIKQVP